MYLSVGEAVGKIILELNLGMGATIASANTKMYMVDPEVDIKYAIGKAKDSKQNTTNKNGE